MRISSLAGLILCAACAFGQQYDYIALPPSNDPSVFVGPVAIDASGNIVGTVETPQYFPAGFLYSQGATTYLPTAYGQHRSEALGINASGVIIGYGDAPHGEIHAMYRTFSSDWVEIYPTDTVDALPFAINDNNYIVGRQLSGPFLGDTSGFKVSLVARLGADFWPIGINNRFDIAGNKASGGFLYNAFSGAITDLHTVLGKKVSVGALNQNGAVAGWVGAKGFIYDNGTITYFGTNIDAVTGMNIYDDVVGDLQNGHAFVYLHGSGKVVDLHELIAPQISRWTIAHAAAINDLGEICGRSNRPVEGGGDAQQGFLLVPLGLKKVVAITDLGSVTQQ